MLAAIKAFQGTVREYRVRPESREECLWERLRTAVLDDYQRNGSKTSRNYPRKKKRQSIGAPTIMRASKQQVNAAQEVKQRQLELRLPA